MQGGQRRDDEEARYGQPWVKARAADVDTWYYSSVETKLGPAGGDSSGHSRESQQLNHWGVPAVS